ncbi:dihydroorotase [Methylovorus glucosotrophus]|uniref:Dihydroorotase, multifunctional complex type n=1 Tax=Methylovorus glucosotrophus (strain SIP3-4) TaxID=582744 RepID=C6X9Q4_METGS|nr:dihydroorotase [Methylovorus glucosotrophus]ACT49874.1 dihydroorotase, multifunctional complex type [Methylovorus glucosotrophus SIP3-4]
MKILIKNGRLIDPKNNIDTTQDIYIAAGKIVGIGSGPAGFEATQTLDASGLLVLPGLVDLSARLREPGFEHKATLESEMQAAVAGGVTSLACPPDTDPVLDEPGLVEMLKHKAKQLHLAHVYPLGAITRQLQGKQLTEMSELTEAGCVGFSQADVAITDTQVLWRAMQYAATFGYTIWLRPEEPYLASGGTAHDGEVASRLGLKGIPAAAETLAIASILTIARETGASIHLCRLSTAEGVEMVRAAKRQGLPVTCDVSINHLHLTEHDIGYFDPNCHLRPPLRGQRDRDALRQGVIDGTIDAICSDHTPVDDDAKLQPFGEAEAGATGLELLLPLVCKWADEQNIPLTQALAAVTTKAAAILDIPAGELSLHADADLCLLDPAQEWKVEANALQSQGKNTPFLGLHLRGKVRYTLVNGQLVYQAA